jgi:hypothetical protein
LQPTVEQDLKLLGGEEVMKMNVEKENQLSRIQTPFRRFVKDILPIAIARVGVKIEPPTVDVIFVPDSYWAKLRHTVHAEKFEADDWVNAKVVSVYMPMPLEDGLRALTELQQTDPNHNCDQHIDYNAMIFLRKRKPARGEEERAVIELYAAMAAACFGLVANAAFGCYGVCPISNPLNDTNAQAAVEALTANMTPAEFARRYGPED